jgi:hypothetical protein
MSDTYYIRVRGRVQGPVDLDRLKELASKGQLNRSHELSKDSKSWIPAGNVKEVFERPSKVIVQTVNQASTTQPSGPPSVSSGLPSNTNPYATSPQSMIREWHYTINGAQMGPVATAEIIELIQHKSLARDDLVWKNGMPQWTQATYLPEFVAAFSNSKKSRKVFETGVGERKSKAVAIVLLLLFGLLGVHEFYMKNILRGILYLIVVAVFFVIQTVVVSETGQVNVPLSLAPYALVLIGAVVIAFKSDESFQASCHKGFSL